MLLSEDEFLKEYGAIYEEKKAEALKYTQHPELLRQEVDELRLAKDLGILHAPEVDLYAYRMSKYRGFLRYPSRLMNAIVAKEDAYSTSPRFQPTIMDIEPNSRCNFRCTMCQVSQWKNGNRAADLSLEELKAFIDQNEYITEVKLHGLGEPLMHKHYMDMLEFLVEKDIWTRTTINGSLLHVRDNAKRLIDSGIGEIQTSFDGATKEVFEKIRVKSDFDRVVENLTRLNEYANTKERLYTRMWVLLQKTNMHQIFDFVKLAKKMNFRRMSYSITLNDWGDEGWKDKNNESQVERELLESHEPKLLELMKTEGIDITVWKQGSKYVTDQGDRGLCPWPFSRPYISSDMRVVPCCMLGNPDTFDLGSAEDFSKVWTGADYQNFRRDHLEGKIPECCLQCYDPSLNLMSSSELQIT